MPVYNTDKRARNICMYYVYMSIIMCGGGEGVRVYTTQAQSNTFQYQVGIKIVDMMGAQMISEHLKRSL